jgi:mannose-6-phosphate isomerase-like protein (cupin superfamily)
LDGLPRGGGTIVTDTHAPDDAREAMIDMARQRAGLMTAEGSRAVEPDAVAGLPREVEKPWGHEEIWAQTDRYVGKILVIETGRRLSFQYHDVKDEWIRVLSGRLLLTIEDDGGAIVERELGPGEAAHVAPRRHRSRPSSGPSSSRSPRRS